MGEATDSSTEVPTVFNNLIWQKLNQAICNQTEVSETVSAPKGFGLMQNYPNPFNPVTSFVFSVAPVAPRDLAGGGRVPSSELVRLRVCDILGREVATLVNEMKQPGTYNVQWNASGVASGVYLYRLQAGAFVQTRKLMLLR